MIRLAQLFHADKAPLPSFYQEMYTSIKSNSKAPEEGHVDLNIF